MAAPERFADTADSSCNACVVHTWHGTADFCGAAISYDIVGPADVRLPWGPGNLHLRLNQVIAGFAIYEFTT